MQESNVYGKLHILPLESKILFRDLSAYEVKNIFALFACLCLVEHS